MNVAIVDYGMSNLKSVFNAVSNVITDNSRVRITNNYKDIDDADKIIFPGQGAIKDCMSLLKKKNLVSSLRKAIDEKPFLGICLGLQSLFEFSYEGEIECLSVLKGKVYPFKNLLFESMHNSFKVPHMGWNLHSYRSDHFLWSNIPKNSFFYYVHSFYIPFNPKLNNTYSVESTTNYMIDFTSSVSFKNCFAVQFHPEKSGKVGLKFIENFINWKGT